MTTATAPARTDASPAALAPAGDIVTATPAASCPTAPPRALATWAARIEADGIAAHEDLAQRVVQAASRRGLCPVLVDVLADPTEPAVARERAFGRLALSLAAR